MLNPAMDQPLICTEGQAEAEHIFENNAACEAFDGEVPYLFRISTSERPGENLSCDIELTVRVNDV